MSILIRYFLLQKYGSFFFMKACGNLLSKIFRSSTLPHGHCIIVVTEDNQVFAVNIGSKFDQAVYLCSFSQHISWAGTIFSGIFNS